MWKINDRFYLNTNEKDLVLEMRSRSWDPRKTDEKFMMAVAGRAELQTGEKIRYDNHRNFIKDLTKAGLIIKVTVH